MSATSTKAVEAERLDLEQELSIGETLDKLEERAVWLDAEFQIPQTDLRIGVSTIFGLLPGAGDGLMMLIAASIVYHGVRLGAPTLTLLWMLVIVLVEGIVSVIPVLGDIIGLIWPANIQNVGYLRANRDALDGSTNWLFVLILASPFILLIVGVVSLI